MGTYSAIIRWERGDHAFTDNTYSRAHRWHFDGGQEVLASSAPQVVPPPYSDPAGIDPEEAFVAALSSCHMLWFLAVAAKRGFTVDRYEDDAVGVMAPNATGKLAITEVTLRPKTVFASPQPTVAQVEEMHHRAHAECFIANSVTTRIIILPRT